MADPGPAAKGPPRWELEAFGTAAAGRRPALAAFSAFSYIPTRREGPPELSYFNRAAKNMFSPMTPFLEYRKVTTVIFPDVTENMEKVVVSTLMRRESLHGLVVAQGFSLGFDVFHAVLSPNYASTEMARPVPVRSSSEYGKRINKPLEQPTKDHVRVNHLHAALYGENRRTRVLEKPSPRLDPR